MHNFKQINITFFVHMYITENNVLRMHINSSNKHSCTSDYSQFLSRT